MSALPTTAASDAAPVNFADLLRWELRQLGRSRLLWTLLALLGAAMLWGAHNGAALHRAQDAAIERSRASDAAWAAQIRKKGEVVFSFFGDGASKQGAFFETLNIASLWKLPAIFVMENNGYNVVTTTAQEDANAAAGEPLSTKAKAFAMPGVTVDGFDPLAVYATVGDAVERAPARQRFEQHGAEGEHIAPRINGAALELLGRHVMERAEDLSVPRDGRRRGLDVVEHGPVAHDLGEAEVEELDLRRPLPGGPRDHDVAGLEIAVHDAVAMRLVERVGDLDGTRERLIEGEHVVAALRGLDLQLIKRLAHQPLPPLEAPFAACIFDQQAPHRFRRGGEEMPPRVPALRLLRADQPQICLMH